jgi:co-chaperonin GroES (HSP10)
MPYSPVKLSSISPLRDHIIVEEMDFGNRYSQGGILLRDDNMKTEGVRPRWGRVFAVGPEQTDIKVGEWILVEHGRWTRAVKIEDVTGTHTIMRVDNKAIIMRSENKPVDDTIGDPSPV